MTRRIPAVCVVLVLLMSGVASAQTPTAPKESAEVAAIRVKANAGDAQAQSTLGMSYLGRGVPQDYAQAASWFRKAGGAGDSQTHRTSLGLCLSAVGVSRRTSWKRTSGSTSLRLVRPQCTRGPTQRLVIVWRRR